MTHSVRRQLGGGTAPARRAQPPSAHLRSLSLMPDNDVARVLWRMNRRVGFQPCALPVCLHGAHACPQHSNVRAASPRNVARCAPVRAFDTKNKAGADYLRVRPARRGFDVRRAEHGQ